jgi:hypothetical protein
LHVVGIALKTEQWRDADSSDTEQQCSLAHQADAALGGDESLEIYARVSDQEWEQRLSSVLDATVDASLVPRLPQLDISPEQEGEFHVQAMAHALLGANLNADRASA